MTHVHPHFHRPHDHTAGDIKDAAKYAGRMTREKSPGMGLAFKAVMAISMCLMAGQQVKDVLSQLAEHGPRSR